MRILLIAQYFFTPEQAGSARLYEFGRLLAKAGHRPVLVTTTIDNFTKQVPPEYRGRWLVREEIDGLEVVRVRAFSRYRGSYALRIVNFVSFMVTATFAALRTGPCDVVFGTTPPPTVGIVAWLVSRIRRRPLIFEIRDLWPEAAVALGILRNRILIRLLVGLERFLCRGATAVIALTPGLKRRLVSGKGIEEAKITVITNGMNPTDFAEEIAGAEAKARMGLEGRFVVMQAGSIGASDDLDVMVRAASDLSSREDYRFVLVGDGDARPGLEKLSRDLGLSNVIFEETRPRRELPWTLAAADVLISQIPGFYADCALPNRMFDYLASGRPVITTGHGDAGDLLREGDAGLVVTSGDSKALAAAIERLRSDPAERERLGRNASEYVARSYSWKTLFPRYRALFERVGGAGGGAFVESGEGAHHG